MEKDLVVNIPTVYDPAAVEEKWYKTWEEKGLFHAEPGGDKRPYSIVIPPPNVTGQLHMGHALDDTLQDVLIRFRRMQGYEALWMPGSDHAGIATQIKVEEVLAGRPGSELVADLIGLWLEAGALFTEESCSFSHQALVDQLQQWADKARAALVAQHS